MDAPNLIAFGAIMFAGFGFGCFFSIMLKFVDFGIARLIGSLRIEDDFKNGLKYLSGNANRMCITTDISDLNAFYENATLHLNCIYSLNKHRLLQTSGREGL